MFSIWQRLSLENFLLHGWQDSSVLFAFVNRPLRRWRQSSFLMQWGDVIGASIVSCVYLLAPFSSNDLLGILLVCCAGFWLLLTLSDDSGVGVTPVHWMVLLYWCVATVATAVSPVKKAAFSGWTKLTLYLIIFALLSRLLRSPRIRSWLIAVYLHAALVVSAYGIRQWFFKVEALATWTDPTSSTANVTRVYSYLGNPNLLAGYLVPAVAFSLAAFFVWRGWGPKLLALTMFLLNSGCLVLTYSRGGWIGFAVALLAMILLLVLWFSVDFPPVWRRWGLPATLGGLAAILVVAVVLVEPVRDRIFSMFAGREDSSNNFRINVWESVRQMIRAHPILGIGPGNVAFNQVYPLFMKPKFSALSAYSIWLEVAVETGLIGFSCFIWLLVVTFNQARVQFLRLRDLRSVDAFWLMAAVASMLGMLSHGFVDTVWYRPEVSTLWWLVVGMIASFYSVRRRVVNKGEMEAG